MNLWHATRIGFYLGVLLLGSNALWGAKLERHRGQVSINGNIAIQKGQALAVNDRLVAMGAKSFFIVRYYDGSRFLVRNGELTINKLGKKGREVGLIKGTFLSLSTPQRNRPFHVKTKKASLGVRGTKFWVDESPKETYLCVCEGDVQVTNGTGTVTVSKDEDIRVGSQRQRLAKSKANDMMWNMAVDAFKEMGIVIPAR